MRTPSPRDLIKYYGSARENARVVSYWEMFEKMAPAEEASFKDAVVFVGLLLRADTGVAQKDSYLSPFGGEMVFGVEVHATIAGNLLEQSWIRRPSRALELAAVGLVGGVATFIGLSYSPIILASAVGALAAGWLLASLISISGNFFDGLDLASARGSGKRDGFVRGSSPFRGSSSLRVLSVRVPRHGAEA
jgi:CHASE2 domain-containing sensor protein